jgi:hypothetical protein
MKATYQLREIRDLLQVPIDKREVCMRELLCALALFEFAAGGGEPDITGMTWTDDGDSSVALTSPEGEPYLSLKVTNAAVIA